MATNKNGNNIHLIKPSGENIIEWVHPDKNGNPKATLENLEAILKAHNIQLSINEMTHELEVDGLHIISANKEDAIVTELEDLAIQYGMAYHRIKSMVGHIAYKQRYHPFVEYLFNLPDWDGKQRVGQIIECFNLDDNGEPNYLVNRMMMLRKWLISVVAAVLREPDDDPIRLVLIICGGQHIGKTTFFKKLFPFKSLFKDGGHLDVTSKDSIRENTRHLCVELGEIDSTFGKRDISRLKAFISRDMDEYREPYAKGFTMRQRKTVFCGTVNDPEFLVDMTGNSRFMVISVNSIDWEKLNGVDIGQLWAQALRYFLDKEKWTLNQEQLEIINASNKRHTETTYIQEIVTDKYDWEMNKDDWEEKSITEVAEALFLDKAMINNTRDQKELKRVLAEVSSIRRHPYRKTKVYLLPKLKRNNTY